MNNTIEWQNDFAIYASNTDVQNGATIKMLSDMPAAAGVCYSFEDGSYRQSEEENCSDNGCVVQNCDDDGYIVQNCNDDGEGVTMGLAQDVIVNGQVYEKNPINAVFVSNGKYASMTPIEQVDIYLQNDIDDGTVLSHIARNPFSVVYEEGEREHTLGYSSATGEFYLEN